LGIRFLHTADLQIGKGFGQFPNDVAGELCAERLKALKRIASLACVQAQVKELGAVANDAIASATRK
jgi:hypothetical protein